MNMVKIEKTKVLNKYVRDRYYFLYNHPCDMYGLNVNNGETSSYSITRSGSYLDLMKNRGINVKNVSQKDKVHISKYNGTISYNYIQTAKQK